MALVEATESVTVNAENQWGGLTRLNFHTCGAPIARSVTQIPNWVCKFTLGANGKSPYLVHPSGNGTRKKRTGCFC